MSNIVTIDQLATEITRAVAQYTEDVASAIEKEVDDTAKAVQADIKAGSPVRTGEYKKGWTRKKSRKGGSVTQTIYNKNKPQPTHLLEHGHAKRGGGRVEGKPHIEPAYDKHVPAMERRIEQIIKDGG